MGLNRENLFLITIYGHNPKASGMSLNQVQNFLIALGCIDAINLDGGGSSTMWLNNGSLKGVVNCPSDNKIFDNQGERKVASALVLLSN